MISNYCTTIEFCPKDRCFHRGPGPGASHWHASLPLCEVFPLPDMNIVLVIQASISSNGIEWFMSLMWETWECERVIKVIRMVLRWKPYLSYYVKRRRRCTRKMVIKICHQAGAAQGQSGRALEIKQRKAQQCWCIITEAVEPAWVLVQWGSVMSLPECRVKNRHDSLLVGMCCL